MADPALTDAEIAHLDAVQAHEDRVAATAAINAQTATMAKMVAASTASAALMQQLLDQPVPSSSGITFANLLELIRLVIDKPEPAP